MAKKIYKKIGETGNSSSDYNLLGNLISDDEYNSFSSKVNKSGDTMTGSLTIQQGNSINVSQYNDAGGVSLMNNGGGTATQFGSSSRPARMFSSVQPEWYKNGASQGVLALKSDIPTDYVTLSTQQTITSNKLFNYTPSGNLDEDFALKINYTKKANTRTTAIQILNSYLEDGNYVGILFGKAITNNNFAYISYLGGDKAIDFFVNGVSSFKIKSNYLLSTNNIYVGNNTSNNRVVLASELSSTNKNVENNTNNISNILNSVESNTNNISKILNNYVTTNTTQTISGTKTFSSPSDVSGKEITTLKVNTSNGGAIIFGKEGANSGTMIRLDQNDGTCRLRFRASGTSTGAMVWEQPENGAQLFLDFGGKRTTMPNSGGTLAYVSQIPTKTSQLTNDSNYVQLDSNNKISSSFLPSYVDDVIDGYLYNGKFYKENTHTTEISGETGKIYVDLSSNKTYRWSGSVFTEISASLALGETSSTAYAGDKGAKNASDISVLKSHFDSNGNALSAVKATQDGSGNVITSTYVNLSGAQNISGSKTFGGVQHFIGESKFSNSSFCPEDSIADIANGIGKSSLFARSATMQTIAGQIIAPNATANNDTYGYDSESGKIKLQYISASTATKVTGTNIAVFSKDNITFTCTNTPTWNGYNFAVLNSNNKIDINKLPSISAVSEKVGTSQKAVVGVSKTKNKVTTFSYDSSSETLSITLSEAVTDITISTSNFATANHIHVYGS